MGGCVERVIELDEDVEQRVVIPRIDIIKPSPCLMFFCDGVVVT
jgi:hypothetical protein